LHIGLLPSEFTVNHPIGPDILRKEFSMLTLIKTLVYEYINLANVPK